MTSIKFRAVCLMASLALIGFVIPQADSQQGDLHFVMTKAPRKPIVDSDGSTWGNYEDVLRENYRGPWAFTFICALIFVIIMLSCCLFVSERGGGLQNMDPETGKIVAIDLEAEAGA